MILFAAVWLLVIAQRLFELRLSARHEAALAARGGYEMPGSRLLPIALAHVAWLAVWLWEEWALGPRPPALWPALAALALGAEALRLWAITSLGPRWTARVFAVPGEPLVARGPYRWMAHPNYLAVALETFLLPLAFGAWRAAAIGLALYLATLSLRWPAERRARRLALSQTLDRNPAKP
ncbi:MAG TPA: isoprenylcysteine carboxylmethyltransferase family protein [Candidatus Eisenbacteria bacterium]|jgi:methyltransferase|nr:isoprenylcysteine carboxylmethyltransferase family protein [Candidatus Eisenbacteria bacterium]